MNANAIHHKRHPALADYGLLVIRVMVGAVFLFHGSQKLFGLFGGPGLSGTAGWMGSIGIPVPTVSAVLAGSAEFFGGLAVLAGIGLRLAVVPMIFTMIVAIITVHAGHFSAQAGGMEYPLTLAAVLLGLGLLGPGCLALHWPRASALPDTSAPREATT